MGGADLEPQGKAKMNPWETYEEEVASTARLVE